MKSWDSDWDDPPRKSREQEIYEHLVRQENDRRMKNLLGSYAKSPAKDELDLTPLDREMLKGMKIKCD